jgi:hypothetical protein
MKGADEMERQRPLLRHMIEDVLRGFAMVLQNADQSWRWQIARAVFHEGRVEAARN